METLYRNRIENALKHWYVPLVIGIIFIGVGILTFTSPLTSLVALGFLFSLAFIFGGLAEIVFAVSNRDQLANWGWSLAFGIFTLVVGILLFLDPALSIATLSFYVGFVILFRSISAIGYAIDLKRYGSSSWVGLLILGIIGSIFAFLLLWNPLFAGMSVVLLVALSFIFGGLFNIIFAFQLKRLHNYVEDRE